MALSAAWIFWESANALINPRPLTNLWWVFAAGMVGFLGNEIVAVYRIRAGRRIGSAALIAEGQHARADGLTSIAVAIGMLGVWAGFPRADAVVGFIIGLMVVGILISTMRTVVRRLMDGIDGGLTDQMTHAARHTSGVLGVDQVRARWTGHRLQGDIVVRVDPELTVLKAHHIAEAVEHDLLHATPSLESVTVHIHPQVPGGIEHKLTGHHASVAARDAYRARVNRPETAGGTKQ